MTHYLKSNIAAPIYDHLLARWSRLRAWHWLVIVLLILALITAIFGIPLILYLPCPPTRIPNFAWSTPVTALILIFFAGQSALTALLAAGAALLGSGSTHTESHDAQPDLLRLTPLTPRSITLARLAAVLRVLIIPLAAVIAIRLALLIAIPPHLMEQLYTFTALFPSRAECPFAWTAPEPLVDAGIQAYHLVYAALWRLDLLHLKVSWPLWVISYTLQPVLDIAIFAAIGVAAASRAVTRQRALVWAVLLALGTVLVGFLAEHAAALGLSSLWLASVNPDAQSVWALPWDFGGGITPMGGIAPFWTFGLPVVTPGFVEASLFFEFLWLAGLIVRIGVLWLMLRIAMKGAS